MAFFCVVGRRDGRNPFVVESIWNTADASTEDAPTPTVPTAKRLPALSKVEVAVPPKYALSKTEKRVVDACVNVESPVTPSVPLNVPLVAESVVRLRVPAVSTPMLPLVEKRFVDDAVVENIVVDVALASVVLPLTVSEASTVAPASSVSAPMLIAPKPVVIEPASSPPTEVSEEARTLEPSVVAFNTSALLMRKLPPVARFTLPLASVSPPEKVEVALLPTMLVVAVPPMESVP